MLILLQPEYPFLLVRKPLQCPRPPVGPGCSILDVLGREIGDWGVRIRYVEKNLPPLWGKLLVRVLGSSTRVRALLPYEKWLLLLNVIVSYIYYCWCNPTSNPPILLKREHHFCSRVCSRPSKTMRLQNCPLYNNNKTNLSFYLSESNIFFKHMRST